MFGTVSLRLRADDCDDFEVWISLASEDIVAMKL